MYRMDNLTAEFSLTATKQREVDPYDDITLLVARLALVYWSELIASFASALVEKYGRI